jgi:hypothetical protein
MRAKVAREIRKFLKQSQGLDLSHEACEERGIRGEPIGEIDYRVFGELQDRTVTMYRIVNPEKNYYRKIKKKWTLGQF